MVREDLVEGAVSFLQDPSVANAPIEQRVAFLRSKNLTQEEIDTSLARVGQGPAPAGSQPPPVQYQQAQQYNAYPQQGYPQYWQAPPELPRRDWRDWFIAATVMGGVGYALLWTAKRYVMPLIAPPTPAQLEQDKASVDASFEKAFALLEQLATDTQELKDSEAARKERLDAALSQVEAVVSKMKQANDDREMEAKRVARELSDIRDQIPKALEKEKEMTDNRLRELGDEMKSLKTLVSNRMSGGVAPPRPTSSVSTSSNGVNGNTPSTESMPLPTGSEKSGVNGTSGEEGTNKAPYNAGRDGGSSYSRFIGGKAAIPAWQLGPKKRSEETKTGETASGASTATLPNTGESGTVSEVTDAQT